VVIKFFEGLSTFIFDLWRAEFRSGIRGRLAYLLMRPGIRRIRHIFDYERAGGSPLLGVKGAVIITHGRAKRRMIGFACEVAANTARTGVPGLIADALREDALREAPMAMPPPPADAAAAAAAAAEPGTAERLATEPGGGA
jgi:fatty acid/phospholipid biosynthesis enzyme